MSKIKSAIRLFVSNRNNIIKTLGRNNMLNWMSDESYIKLAYKNTFGKKLDLNNPISFNEKLQWLKLYDRKREYITYVDKFAVREYIEKTIGKDYLIPLIGVYESVDVIPWGELPNSFVLKCTHGSGCNIICKDKNHLNIQEAKNKLNRWMKTNYFWNCREWPYKNVKPRIVCEEFITDKETTPDDYKVLCFNGKAKLIMVHIDRYGDHKLDNYDRHWNKTTLAKDGPMSDSVYKKPKQFDNMIRLSEILASNMSHARIDWFIVRDKLLFGEITLYEAGGFDHFDNKQDDDTLGSWIDLPIEKIQ